MLNKKNLKIFLILLFVFFLIYLFYSFFNKKTDVIHTEFKEPDNLQSNSNIIKNVNFVTKDKDGNEYIISAVQGEIDYSNTSTLYLTELKALINLKDADKITINSDYGKYNTDNYDTIFSKNVIIKYQDNIVTGEYLDFSLEKNTMIISREVVFTNTKNILKADVIEINIKTKDAKIFMYEENKKVNIKSIN